MGAIAANVWALSIVQAPCRRAPCSRYDSQLCLRRMTTPALRVRTCRVPGHGHARAPSHARAHHAPGHAPSPCDARVRRCGCGCSGAGDPRGALCPGALASHERRGQRAPCPAPPAKPTPSLKPRTLSHPIPCWCPRYQTASYASMVVALHVGAHQCGRTRRGILSDNGRASKNAADV